MHKSFSLLVAAFCSLSGMATIAHGHEHIPAGAAGSGPLEFVSGALSGTIYHMLPETGPRYTGYLALDEQIRTQFPNDYFSFTALSDGQTEDAQPNHASTGTDIWLEITSVSGPTGATFGFWDAGWSYTHNTPTASFLTNTSTGGYKFELSEPLFFVSPEDQDPYGHIHDRGWTVDRPGDYFVGFTLYDLSGLGADGGPIHPHSETYIFHFLAVPEPGSLPLLLAGVSLLARRLRRHTPQDLSSAA